MITKIIKNTSIILLAILGVYLYFTNVEYVSSLVLNSAKFSLNYLFPTLFPNLILAGIITGSIRVDAYKSYERKTFLGNCKIYSVPIIVGMISGFILGPKAICSIYNDSKGDERDFSLAIALSSNAGIGFVVGCVGIKIWKDVIYGFVLYFGQIIAALLVFYLLKSKNETKRFSSTALSKNNASNVISKAIINAFNSVCIICAFYVFFNSLIELLVHSFSLNVILNASISSIFDFSGAVFKFHSLNQKHIARFLTGFTVGFAGISIHLQTFLVCDGYPLKKFLFSFYKLFQGVLCGFISLLYDLY